MDRLQEDKRLYYKKREEIFRKHEEQEAKTNEAIRSIFESSPTSIGPANDLLRYLYIVEQQYQSDNDETRTRTRETFNDYLAQSLPSDEVIEEAEEEQEEENDQPPDELQSKPTTSHQQLSPTIPQPQPPVASAVLPQPPPTSALSPRPPPANVLPPQASAVPPQPVPLPTSDPDYIKPDTMISYQRLFQEAQQYERRYTTVGDSRKSQLAKPLKNIMNKLRQETYDTLKQDLLNYLNGEEHQVIGQSIRISNNDERLLCLSMIASLVFKQLLGGDLTSIKTDIFLPLVGFLSADQQQKEFRVIFLDRLHKRCPYTVPYYPPRQPNMTDKQYYEALGYIVKKEGDQTRIENDQEFLNRMSGLIRFFCKLLVRRGPPFDSRLSYAWKWMADVLNLRPRPNITAVILRIFLDETGESMLNEYQDQFKKILQVVASKYIPRLAGDTNPDQITRLQLVLETLLKNNS